MHKILKKINDKVGTKRVKHINQYFVNKRFLTLYVKFSGEKTSLRERKHLRKIDLKNAWFC